MTRSRLVVHSLVLAGALSACSADSSAVNADLDRDLAAVRASAVDLAPRAAERAMVVSVEEQAGTKATVRTAVRRPSAPSTSIARRLPERLPVSAPVATTAEAEAEDAPAPTAAIEAPHPAEPVVTGPLRSPPQPTPAPRGGYRSVSDVIRNAPFPINP